MTPCALLRTGRVLLAALFLTAVAQSAYRFSPCAHHQASAAGAHAGHGGMDHGAHAAHQPAGAGHDGVCTCLGECQIAVATVAPAWVLPTIVSATARAAAPQPPAEAPRPARVPYLLPYSTAPPAPLT